MSEYFCVSDLHILFVILGDRTVEVTNDVRLFVKFQSN